MGDFLARFAKKAGKLLKGGEPDFHNCAVMVLHDWQRGKLPWFVCPPFEDDLEKEAEEKAAMEVEEAEEAKKDEPDMDFEPVQLLQEIAHTHEFAEADQSEQSFQAPAASTDSAGPSAEELAGVTVENPLGLAPNDPLLLAAKRRKWEETHRT